MKQLKLILVAILFVSNVTLQSCDSDNNSSSGNTEELFVTYTLNGETIDARGSGRVASTFSLDNNDNLTGTLSISANNGLASSDSGFINITLSIPDYTVSSGTFNWDPSITATDPYRCFVRIDGSSKLLNEGSITITSNDSETITGTFNGTFTDPMTNTVDITIVDGSFRAISNPN